MQEWLTALVTNHPIAVYAVIILISFVEGPILAIVGGLLIRLGFFPLIPLYIALMAGDLLGDIVWYHLGRYFGIPFVAKFGKYFSLTTERVEAVQKIFHTYKNRILIVSKLTMGFGFAVATLFTAGMVRIPFGRYMLLNGVGQFLWTTFLLSVGYYLGHLYDSISNVLGKVSILAAIVLIFFAFIGYGQYVRNRWSEKTR